MFANQARQFDVARYHHLGALILVIGLGGCAYNSMGMYGGEVGRADVDGSKYSVRYTADRAEATRTNMQMPAGKLIMLGRAQQAIEEVSGCSVRPGTLVGDFSFAKAALECPPAEETADASAQTAQ
ncbi:MAG: hypothetical protein AAGF71_00735 [Pseudomonadota bacterium]